MGSAPPPQILNLVGCMWLMSDFVVALGDDTREGDDFTAEMERRLRMDW